MTDPLELRGELEQALSLAAREAAAYTGGLAEEPVLDPAAEGLLDGFEAPLPEHGSGAIEALTELAGRGRQTATRSSGPRFFHFVMGGTTPAALGADWLTSAFDQVAYAWASSPLGSKLEGIAVRWLRDLFELPEEFAGVLVSGATMANFTGLIAARSWWAQQLGFDADEAGLAGAAAPRILSSGYLHPSAAQAIGMLGFGRANIRRLSRDSAGRLDLEALAAELAEPHAEGPAIVIANAGEVNAGDFDPIEAIARLTREHGAWLHVDGAFGLFARLAPESRHLGAGIEHADSITVDAHKWLNVPYDCGYAFVRDPSAHADALSPLGAAYIVYGSAERDEFRWVPEFSRRARGFPTYAALRSLGRVGVREMVEGGCRLATRMADGLRGSGVEILNDVVLDQILARFHPADGGDADACTRQVISRVQADGTCWLSGTTWHGMAAMRISIVNWSTTEEDIDRSLAAILEAVRGE